MVHRRHYITAYRRALQEELKKAASMFAPTVSPVIKEMERCLYAELNELHRILSAAGILVYRNFVLTVAQRQGDRKSVV